MGRAKNEEDETILVEIQKFGDNETEIFALRLIQKEKIKEYRKLLGISSDVVVINRRKQKDSERTKVSLNRSSTSQNERNWSRQFEK